MSAYKWVNQKIIITILTLLGLRGGSIENTRDGEKEMNIKMLDGVSLVGLRPEMLFGHSIVIEVFRDLGHETLHITSIRDGQHSKGSRHYIGLAIDYDVIGLDKSDFESIAEEIRARLTTEFDVIVHTGHIHVEFDPKRNTRT